jgi:NAD-dependent SIR2 family protein deacetylase
LVAAGDVAVLPGAGLPVPRPRVEASYELVERAGSLVVLGSSLPVASGYRFVRHAARLGRPIAIVNQATTRAAGLAEPVLDAPLGVTLAAVTARVAALRRPAAATPGPE